MVSGFRGVLARLVRLTAQPLLLAQISASLSGAIAMILAAAFMAPEEFVVFSLINLISVTSVGAVRAGLLQPALIQQRTDPTARTSFLQAAAAAVVASGAATAAMAAIHPLTPGQAALLLGSGLLPILHDWVRFRAMSLDRRWYVLAADGFRLVLVAAASPLALGWTTDPVIFQAVQGLALALPALVVALRLPRVHGIARLGSYRRAAMLQLTDFAVGQFNTTIPLIVLGGLATSDTIAGVRFAQTLLGPLNLLFSANTANLLTDAATNGELADDTELVRRGSALASRLGLLSLGVVTALGVGAWLTGFELRGVRADAVLVGLALVGPATASSGWAGIHAILLRLLGRQGTATAGRTGLVLASTTGYLIGYLIGGVDLSVTVGFLTAAVASPFAFVVPARRAYRTIEGRHPRGDVPNPGPDT